MVEVIDQDGNVRGISYNLNGEQTGTTFHHYPTDGRPPVVDPNTDPVAAGYTAADFPSTRTQLRTENDIDFAGEVTSSRTYVTEQTLDAATLTYIDGPTTVRNESGFTEFDALGRTFRTTDENGRVSETIFDSRGLAIETRSESPDETGSGVWLISRTVYDSEGRAVYSTGSFPESVFTDAPDQITGTHSIYEPGSGRMLESQQLIGVDIDIVGQTASLSSVLTSAGTVISSSRSFYDDNDRVVETENNYGLRSQTLYDNNSRVIESRSEVVASDGTKSWMVSRTIHDDEGKVIASTDRFLVPGDTALGADPLVPVITQITKTIYDSRDRTIATERYTGAMVTRVVGEEPAFTISNTGTLESVSETLYDAAGRVYRTINGRVPLASLSDVALAQSQALANYPIYESVDRYASADLSTGTISDTLFDSRGRQYASLGHPLPAEDVGLSGANYDGNLVRIRSETIYNRYGQTEISRSGLAQVENTDGSLVGVFDNQSVDMQPTFDAFGNVVRTDYITGGTITFDAASGTTTRTGGTVDSHTLTRFDDENRPVAEMQQTDDNVTATWSAVDQTFIDSATSERIPTKLYHYDSDDRLSGVSLGYVDPASTTDRPTYQYAYDERGNQTSIVDPLGRETRFTFTDRGQQATRTLPLGVETPTEGDFAEQFFYDEMGRQSRHISFEGIVSENVYDGFGRMSAMNYYADEADYTVGLITQRDEYVFDAYGRRNGFVRYEASTPVALSTGVTSAVDDPNFAAIRTEATVFDARGRVLHEASPEGTLSYDYDSFGRMTYTAINAVVPPVVGSIGTPADPTTAERVTSYGYDILGRLASVQEDATPNNATDDPQTDTSYSFDLLGRQRAQLTIAPGDPIPNGIETTYQYDSLGRLDEMTDADTDGNVTASYDYTVRPDGRRTASTETFWIDENSDGTQDAGELKANSYTWSYDGLNRLTDEVLDHWDDAFDQTENYTYDLTGNRTALDRDTGNDGSIDEAITYSYDANDRLLEETLDSLTGTDTTTTYGFDHTQQTSKVVTAGGVTVSGQSFTFDLQGRLSTVVNDGYENGTLNSRERTTYEYDMRKYRVQSMTETGATLSANLADETWSAKSSVEFLVSHRNHTGYAQTLRETRVENGNTLTIDYTFGHDEISQRKHGVDADGNTIDETLVFGHDGHGSVKVLHNLAATAASLIEQVATYAAYGSVIAVHSGIGAVAGTNESTFKSTQQYSGEQWDSSLRMQNLRARPYDPRTGRFMGEDPFRGNMQDPQSLHKYAYVHGDPVGGIDPTGRSLAVRIAVGVGIGVALTGIAASAANSAYGYVAGHFSAKQAGIHFVRNSLLSVLAGVATTISLIPAMFLSFEGTFLLYSTLTALAGAQERGTFDEDSKSILELADYHLRNYVVRPNQMIRDLAPTVKTIANEEGVPAELLGGMLLAELTDYSILDLLGDHIVLPGVYGDPDDHSIGMAQLRVDNIRNWNIYLNKWGATGAGATEPQIRESLYDSDDSIRLLAKAIKFFDSQGYAPGDPRFGTPTNLGAWDSLSQWTKEGLASDFGGGKDNIEGYLGTSQFSTATQLGVMRVIEMGIFD